MTLSLTEPWHPRVEEIIARFRTSAARNVQGLSREDAISLRSSSEVIRDYLEATITRCSHVRTLLYREMGADLGRLYVSTLFSRNEQEVSEDELFAHVANSHRVIVSGTAGSGKSMFMKHVALHGIRSECGKIPIMVEMRNINHSQSSILQHIRDDVLGAHMPDLNDEILDALLRSGLFRLVLDGLDETHFERRSVYRQELDYICRRYSSLEIILSTRPEEETLALPSFTVYRVLPLPQETAKELISRIEYDPIVKTGFISNFKKIYTTHFEMASNPLLLTMLLLTYDQVGEIPSRMHVFYNQAFETLVLKHDRLKAHYVRPTYSTLDLESIKKVYSLFCTASFAENEISFTEERCLALVGDSLSYYNIGSEAPAILNDLIFSYSMLKRDGLFITFVHRSFQEYFCAVFVSKMPVEEFGITFDALLQRASTDACVSMLCDMVPDLILAHWGKPLLETTAARLEQLAREPSVSGFAREFYGSVQMDREGILHLRMRSPILDKLALCAELLGDRNHVPLFDRMNGPISEQRLKAFFGSRDPFGYQIIEPISNDNVWLRESWVEQHLVEMLQWVRQSLVRMEEIEAARSEKAKLKFRAAPRDRHSSNHAEFYVEGTPQRVTDPRTGKTKLVPQSEVAYRKTFDRSR